MQVRRPTDTKTVLLVDDAMVFCEAVSMWTSREGYRTLIASTGQEALDLLRLGVPDLIILDMLMPVMDGPTFLKTLRGNPAWKQVPVILLTGVAIAHAETEVGHLGVSAFMQKGQFSLADLLAKARSILGTETPAAG